MRGVNGKLLIAQYKYGNDPFTSYEKALELVQQYPIVYSVLPKEMKNREMTVAFVKANGACLARYQEILSKIQEEDRKLRSEGTMSALSGLHAPYFEEEATLKNNAFVDTVFDLGEFTKDEEILTLAMRAAESGTWFTDSVGGFILTPENYDEKTLLSVAKRDTRMVCRLYHYWAEYIGQFPKVCESVKVKYGLCNQPSEEELAVYKCLSIIEDRGDAVAHLLNSYALMVEVPTNPDHINLMRGVMARLSVETQNEIVSGYYQYAQYVRAGVLAETAQAEIAKRCPIAGDILPDSAVIKYALSQSDSDEDAYRICKRCGKCAMSHMVCV